MNKQKILDLIDVALRTNDINVSKGALQEIKEAFAGNQLHNEKQGNFERFKAQTEPTQAQVDEVMKLMNL